MRCEAAELELSARLDAAADRELDEALAHHVATCTRCRGFEARARRVRELVRIEPAAPVPDLVPGIMAAVREEPVRRVPALPREAGRYAAAFVAGAVAASLVLGGLPALRRGPPPALATEIPRGVAEASRQVTAYRATFDVTERNFRPEVPLRRFQASVAFRAPERFRAVVKDRTAYPSTRWPRNDLVLEVTTTVGRSEARRPVRARRSPHAPRARARSGGSRAESPSTATRPSPPTSSCRCGRSRGPNG